MAVPDSDRAVTSPDHFVVEGHPSLAHIGAATWGRLAHDAGFYLGYPWLAWAEADPAFTTHYLVCRDPAGAAVAAVATYLWNGTAVPSMNLAYSPGHLAQEGIGRPLSAAEHREFLPVLLVGSRAGYHGGVVMDARLGPVTRAAVLTSLFAAVEALADRIGAGSVAMLYVPVAHAIECRNAWERAAGESERGTYLAPLSTEAVMRVGQAGSADEARPAGRREWRRERRRYEAAVDRVETVPLSHCVEMIAPLLGATQRKYGGPDTDAEMFRYLAGQVPELDAYSQVLLEYRGSSPVAFSLNYLWHDGVYVRAAGFDRQAAPYSYFNLTIYRACDLAATRGLPIVNLGAGTYAAKRARGAEPWFTAGLVRPPAGTPPELLRAFQTPGSDFRQATQVWHHQAPPMEFTHFPGG